MGSCGNAFIAKMGSCENALLLRRELKKERRKQKLNGWRDWLSLSVRFQKLTGHVFWN